MTTYHQLTQEERYIISAQLMCGHSQAHVAHLLQRHRSTISRELRRNATTHDGRYRAEKAHSYAVARRRRCRRRPHFSVAAMAPSGTFAAPQVESRADRWRVVQARNSSHQS